MGIKQLAFFVTERCQYSCEYCDIPYIKHPKDYDIGTFLTYMPIINNHELDFITITGGEPGLLPEMQLEFLFNTIKHPINVNTNGEFIKRGYYDRWKDQILLLDYHVTGINVEYKPKGNVRYILVQHRLNQAHIELMEIHNPDIHFTIYDYDDKLNEPKFIIKDNINLYKDCFWPIKEIDWVNRKLVDCCCSPISSPKDKLSDRNLKRFLVINYARPWHGCTYCTRQKERYAKSGSNITDNGL